MEDSDKSLENNLGNQNTCWKPPEGTEKSNNNEENIKNNANVCKVRYNRIFKKVSSDGNLVLFLPQRELAVSEKNVESLMGVALIHENVMKVVGIKVFLH